ncbi:uncharacterized protein CLUP02_01503 [Colletotrichum lupini]|uniref:Uncharacterized protein n=1 Tax=Colletotrichum lupini TaxID=145971 RepID=A0A9Q8SCG3_9PEZI|nr:uncharacterized protein CLUP02_01503 [Colletotrichum lupini]UQC74851.1 hypothetical protein CLUP02_01503 [Colletotrichum lupini]
MKGRAWGLGSTVWPSRPGEGAVSSLEDEQRQQPKMLEKKEPPNLRNITYQNQTRPSPYMVPVQRQETFLITSLPSVISCFHSSEFLSSLTILLLIPILSPLSSTAHRSGLSTSLTFDIQFSTPFCATCQHPLALPPRTSIKPAAAPALTARSITHNRRAPLFSCTLTVVPGTTNLLPVSQLSRLAREPAASHPRLVSSRLVPHRTAPHLTLHAYHTWQYSPRPALHREDQKKGTRLFQDPDPEPNQIISPKHKREFPIEKRLSETCATNRLDIQPTPPTAHPQHDRKDLIVCNCAKPILLEPSTCNGADNTLPSLPPDRLFCLSSSYFLRNNRAALVTPNLATYPGLLASSPPLYPRQLSPIPSPEDTRTQVFKAAFQHPIFLHLVRHTPMSYTGLPCNHLHRHVASGLYKKLNSNQFSLSKAPTTFNMGVREITPASNMGRGAYDTTGHDPTNEFHISTGPRAQANAMIFPTRDISRGSNRPPYSLRYRVSYSIMHTQPTLILYNSTNTGGPFPPVLPHLYNQNNIPARSHNLLPSSKANGNALHGFHDLSHTSSGPSTSYDTTLGDGTISPADPFQTVGECFAGTLVGQQRMTTQPPSSTHMARSRLNRQIRGLLIFFHFVCTNYPLYSLGLVDFYAQPATSRSWFEREHQGYDASETDRGVCWTRAFLNPPYEGGGGCSRSSCYAMPCDSTHSTRLENFCEMLE